MARRFPMRMVPAMLALAGFIAAGCSGAIGDPAGGGTPSDPVDPGPVGPTTQPVATMHKLTTAEFTNSLHDLLGSTAPVAAAEKLEADQQINGFRSISASVVSISPTGVSQFETAINAATQFAFSSATQAATVLPCVPASVTDSVCSPSKALSAFGRRALRRPLTAEDVSLYVGVATDIAQEPNGSILAGLKYAVSAILQSPEFLYRVEFGTPSAADGGRNKYTDYEMASRLASLLWVSVPDEATLDAAATGKLSTPAGVLAHAKTMLSSPKARQSMANLASDLYGMDPSSGTPLTTTFKDPAFYPNWTPTLSAAMQQELFMRVDDVAFSGDYLSLYDSSTVFVNNELAKVYGLPQAAMDGFRRVTLPAGSPRSGLLGSAAILASNGLPQRTGPTLRGRFVAQQLLCKVVPDPPDNVDTGVLNTLPPNATVKQVLEEHRKNPACAACHAMMDPIGLGLENFDSVGVYRTTENNAPIDASGELDGVPFKDEATLAAALRNHPDAASCFVSKLYEQAQGRASLPIDEKVLTNLGKQFATSGHRADQLLLDIASSDAYRFVQIATK